MSKPYSGSDRRTHLNPPQPGEQEGLVEPEDTLYFYHFSMDLHEYFCKYPVFSACQYRPLTSHAKDKQACVNRVGNGRSPSFKTPIALPICFQSHSALTKHLVDTVQLVHPSLNPRSQTSMDIHRQQRQRTYFPSLHRAPHGLMMTAAQIPKNIRIRTTGSVINCQRTSYSR